MALLLKSDLDRSKAWCEALSRHDPALEIRLWPETGDPKDIEFALVWEPPPGELKRYPSLRAIFSIGAGIDHLSSDPELPRQVPIVRMVESGLTAGMTEFVLMSVLYHHRFMFDYAAQQHAKRWHEIAQVPPWQRRVGLMGLGRLGADAAAKLAGLGFRVAGWSRTPKTLPDVEAFHGPNGLFPFLERSEIVVCLLPLTAETTGILNARTLTALPRGAGLINVARGGHLVERDLIAALDTGHIAGAILDVFREEPLPPEHPFWAHPRVIVTPHVASMTIPDTAAEAVVRNIRRLRTGQPLENVVDLERGY